MAEERRPGQATSRDKISRETASYVGSLQNSNYSDVSEVSMEVLIKKAKIDPLSISEHITMVKGALLPMTLATCNADGKRTQFTLLVNPESINHGKTNAVYPNLARSGFISQVWGPNQDLITGNGKTAAFMTAEVGLTNIGSQRSLGFQNFMAFFSTYRNNGYELMDLTAVKGALTRVINVIHGVELSYDGQIFMGHFNNFTIDEAAETPYIINYNFEFVCSTLSDNYNEIRGHFISINDSDTGEYKARLVSEVGK